MRTTWVVIWWARACPMPGPAVTICSRVRRSSAFSPAVAAATSASQGVRRPSAISCSSSPRAVLARRRLVMSRCMSGEWGRGSHIADLEDVTEGGRFDRRGDRERADRAGGGDAVGGVDLVVAVDDLLQ